MSLIDKDDRKLSKQASGLPDPSRSWKNAPTLITTPSNRTERGQNPYTRIRLGSGSGAQPGKGSSANPNSRGGVFGGPLNKRPKNQHASSSRTHRTHGSSKRVSVDESIDLTRDDAEPFSHNSTPTDSEDSLNIRPPERNKARIANDGPATEHLKAQQRDAEPSRVDRTDSETEVIEEFSEMPKRQMMNKEGKGKVQGMVQDIESRGPGKVAKLPMQPVNPLRSLPLPKPSTRTKHLQFGPTTFTNGSKSKGKEVLRLPLTGLILGTECTNTPERFLSWGIELNQPVLLVRSAQEEFRLNMKSEVDTLQASDSGTWPLVIMFRVLSLRQNPSPKNLEPGTNYPRSAMAFRVDGENDNRYRPARKALYEFLKDKCGCKSWLSGGNVRGAWAMAVQRSKTPTTPEPEERQLSLQKTTATDYKSKRHSSASSLPELPSSIELSPPPGGETPLPPRATQKVERMNPRQIIQEQRETREVEPVAGPSNQPLRRSSRQATLHSGFSAADPTRTPPLDDSDELLLVYRPSVTGAVNITRGDLERLQPGKYLNDTLIEFGLKLWLSDLRDRDPKLADQIHLFSSFFYKKLAVKDKQAGYESVRKWTSRVDIFSKKYLVVPINEHLHWYLAIIYQPEYTLRPAPPTSPPVTRKRKREEELSVDSALEASESRETPTTASKPASKATTETREGGEIETIPDSEPASPRMELEEPTQTDETAKPEEQEVETQLCAEVSSVSLDEREGSNLRKDERDDSAYTSRADGDSMEIDDSPPASPMPVDREVHIEDLTEDSTPLGTVEPPANTRDIAPEAPPVEMEDSFDPGAIDVGSFYGQAAAGVRTSGKKSRVSAAGKLEGSPREGDLGETAPLKTDNTYIFVFDSLNGKHPGAMKNLGNYLRFEANDKKNIENSSDPETMAALVPTQDNYCDCGLYLLHFAKVFMEDPARSFQTILTKRKAPKADRNVDWKKELVGTSREDLTRRIIELSEGWVKERAKEAEEKAKAKEKEGGSKPESIAVDSPESDDEVILEEVVTYKPDRPKKSATKRPEPTKRGPASRGGGRTGSKTEAGPADPVRTPAERFRS